MRVTETERGPVVVRYAIDGTPYSFELTREKPWCTGVRLLEIMSRQTAQGLERARRVHGWLCVQGRPASPFEWACDVIVPSLAAVELPASIDGYEEVFRRIGTAAKAAGFHIGPMPNEDIYAEDILEGLARCAIGPGPEDSALTWYVRHYNVRADAYRRSHSVDFNVGHAVWDDDWVFNVVCELKKQDVDPLGSLIVLVCADPAEYHEMMPLDTRLEWLGAVSGDIVHFVWMIDRHHKPTLATKRAIIDELAINGIRPPDDAPLLMFVTMRPATDGMVEADLEGVVPVLGRLDEDGARELFQSIIAQVKRGTSHGDTFDQIVTSIRREIAALRTLQQTHVLDWFKRVVSRFFGKG